MTVTALGTLQNDLTGGDISSPPAGSNRFLIVSDIYETNGTDTVSAVTVGGQSPVAIIQKVDTTMDKFVYLFNEAQIAAMSGTAIVRTGISPGSSWITSWQFFQDVDQNTPYTSTQEVGYDIDSQNSTGTQTYTLDEVENGLGVVIAGDSKTTGTWGFNGGYSQLGSTIDDTGTACSAVWATKAVSANASAVSTNITNSLTGDKMCMFAIMLLPDGGGGDPNMSGVPDVKALSLTNPYHGVIPGVNGLMTGDSAESGGPLSYKLKTGASNGTLITYLDGYFVYSPDNGFVGTDSFTYDLESGAVIATPTVYLVVGSLSNMSGAPNVKALAISKKVPSGEFRNDVTNPVGLKQLNISFQSPSSSFGQPDTSFSAPQTVLSVTVIAPLGSFSPVGASEITSVNDPGFRVVDSENSSSEIEIYIGRDNTIEMILSESDIDLTDSQMDSITRIQFQVFDQVLDSSLNSSAIKWSYGGGKIEINPSSMSLPSGRHLTRLIIYTTNRSNGVVWIPKGDLIAKCIDTTL